VFDPGDQPTPPSLQREGVCPAAKRRHTHATHTDGEEHTRRRSNERIAKVFPEAFHVAGELLARQGRQAAARQAAAIHVFRGRSITSHGALPAVAAPEHLSSRFFAPRPYAHSESRESKEGGSAGREAGSRCVVVHARQVCWGQQCAGSRKVLPEPTSCHATPVGRDARKRRIQQKACQKAIQHNARCAGRRQSSTQSKLLQDSRPAPSRHAAAAPPATR